MKSWYHHSSLWASVAVLGLVGCAVSPEPVDEQIGETQGAILGGEVVQEGFEAVGALALQYSFETGDPEMPIFSYFFPVCTATLVGPKAVVTAKHCTERLATEQAAGNAPFFVLGQTTWEPEQAIPITSWVEAPPSPTGAGLLLNGGRDLAVAYLSEEPDGVAPATVGHFTPNLMGKQLDIVGYGINDIYLEDYGFYDQGTKVSGKATARALSGPWYSLLFNGSYSSFLDWYMTDADTAAPTPEEAQAWWDSYRLERGYELLAGGLPGESLGCFGDSGGPIMTTRKGRSTIYGVSFATESSLSEVCTRGGAYLIFNAEMQAWVRRALATCPH